MIFNQNLLSNCILKTTFSCIRNKLPQIIILSIIIYLLLFIAKDILKQNNCSLRNDNVWIEIPAPGQIRSVVRIKNVKTENSQSKQKLILLWTKYFSEEFSEDFYFFESGRTTFERYRCYISNCFVTSNRSLLDVADSVLFHASDFNASDIPERHSMKQIWIMYSMEPPRNMHLLKWGLVKSLFNWTMTYRSDSQVQVKYGEIIAVNNSCRTSGIIDVNRKKNGAIWMVSNCKTESRREAYVKELRKYYKVDVYGYCSRKNKCLPAQSERCYKLLESYKYYLAFENSICRDYVTEKLFNAYHYNILPIVFGGVQYEEIVPARSFIDATKFPNPKDLANYLNYIAKNSSLYESFFDWKKHFTVHLHPWMCKLCEHLHNPRIVSSSLPTNLWKWWIKDASCRKWTKRKSFVGFFSNSTSL